MAIILFINIKIKLIKGEFKYIYKGRKKLFFIMITPINPIVPPTASYSGIWVNNINITSMSPTRPISAQIRLTPFDPATGVLAPSNLSKNINIPDVRALSVSSFLAAEAMGGMLNFIQDYVISQSVY